MTFRQEGRWLEFIACSNVMHSQLVNLSKIACDHGPKGLSGNADATFGWTARREGSYVNRIFVRLCVG